MHTVTHGINPPTCCDSNLNGHGTPGVLCQFLQGSFVAVKFSTLSETLMPDETMALVQGIMHAFTCAAVVWKSKLSVSSLAGQEADDIILQVKQLRSQLGSDNIDKILEEYPRQVPSYIYFLFLYTSCWPSLLCPARASPGHNQHNSIAPVAQLHLFFHRVLPCSDTTTCKHCTSWSCMTAHFDLHSCMLHGVGSIAS